MKTEFESSLLGDNQFNELENFSNFRIFGIGQLSERQKERRCARVEKALAKEKCPAANRKMTRMRKLGIDPSELSCLAPYEEKCKGVPAEPELNLEEEKKQDELLKNEMVNDQKNQQEQSGSGWVLPVVIVSSVVILSIVGFVIAKSRKGAAVVVAATPK